MLDIALGVGLGILTVAAYMLVVKRKLKERPSPTYERVVGDLTKQDPAMGRFARGHYKDYIEKSRLIDSIAGTPGYEDHVKIFEGIIKSYYGLHRTDRAPKK